MTRTEQDANERLQPTGKGRGETAVATVKFGGRASSRRLKRGVSCRIWKIHLESLTKNKEEIMDGFIFLIIRGII